MSINLLKCMYILEFDNKIMSCDINMLNCIVNIWKELWNKE